jgi:prepilin-type N-terminal cleavage/methylation domain-containing protein
MYSSFFSYLKKNNPYPHQGFTLIEFIVIISIFAIMASVALFNFTGFRSNVGQNNLAHDIALTIRQAQVFGWSTTTDGAQNVVSLDAAGDPVRFAEGVYIEYPFDQQKEFFLYRKSNAQATQDYTISDDKVDTIKIAGPHRIVAVQSASRRDDLLIDAQHHIPAMNPVGGSLSIAFTRPRPEALFFSGSSTLTDTYIGIYIAGDKDAPGTASHVVTVSRTGEIDVQ